MLKSITVGHFAHRGSNSRYYFAAQVQFDPSKESLSELYPGKTYSPYAQRSFLDQVFWGDTHLHTGLSKDAGLFGARLGLEDVYQFARGDEVMASSGQPVKLSRPLDWLVIADHSDGMGFFNDLAAGKPEVIAFDQAKRWYDGLQQGGEASADAALDLIGTFSQGKIDPEMMAEYSPGGKTYKSIWEKVVTAAEDYYEPGHFTTLIGFEWTSLVKGNNLHRNVIFRDGGEKAGRIVPLHDAGTPIGSTDPHKLYGHWLENYEKNTGGYALAIAHNGNLSNGIMFPVDAQYTGKAIDQNYVELREMGTDATRSHKSRETVRLIPSCHPMMRLPIMRLGMWETSTFQRPRMRKCCSMSMQGKHLKTV